MKTVFFVEIFNCSGILLVRETFFDANLVVKYLRELEPHSRGLVAKCTILRVPDTVLPFDWDAYDHDVSLSDLAELDDDLPWQY